MRRSFGWQATNMEKEKQLGDLSDITKAHASDDHMTHGRGGTGGRGGCRGTSSSFTAAT
jgi:phosphoenolpyruvate carboxylase